MERPSGAVPDAANAIDHVCWRCETAEEYHDAVKALADAGHADFVVDRVRRAIEADHRVGGRLALWGRRLMGEALSQAQRVAAERDSLAALLAGGVDRPGMDLAALSWMFSRLTENHAKRMAELGLAS